MPNRKQEEIEERKLRDRGLTNDRAAREAQKTDEGEPFEIEPDEEKAAERSEREHRQPQR